jgi:predicted nuclease with TOPRIM domain
MSDKPFNDPLTLEELTERVIELGERVARLETLVEEFRKLDAKIDRVRDELREEFKAEIRRLETRIDRLDAKIDRFFWLWVSTIVAAFILRLLKLV